MPEEQMKQIRDALAPLIEAGWVVARFTYERCDQDGTHAYLKLRFDPPKESDIL